MSEDRAQPPSEESEQESGESSPVVPVPEEEAELAEEAAAYVTDIESLERQVGTHVIRALEHDGAAGVLTVARAGPAGQRLVSVPLDEDLFAQIQELIAESSIQDQARDVPCIGFHCRLEVPEAGEEEKPEK